MAKSELLCLVNKNLTLGSAPSKIENCHRSICLGARRVTPDGIASPSPPFAPFLLRTPLFTGVELVIDGGMTGGARPWWS